MSSTFEYEDHHSQSDSSTEEDNVRPTSRAVSATPFSPRKRRRSSSVDSLRSRKRHLDGKYNDAYRVLYNDTVNAASTRCISEDTFQPYATTVGVSKWSATEKSAFFAALERLGRDNLPGIAGAIASKSIPETRQFLLLIQEAYAAHNAKPKNVKVTLADIPAALEVGAECRIRLELAGDALSWYQERFEAKQEQERYGRYWLITPEVADEIEEAISAPLSKAATPEAEIEQDKPGVPYSRPVSDVLRVIPEASLLDTTPLLHLSKHYFMNPSAAISYPWPHWTELVNELADEPSIYRSAFRDLHTLVVSLTKRLVQTAIIQATARIRTQGWRLKKGLSPYVKRRDVLTSIDILGLQRNGSERWRGVARRCGLRVQKAIRRIGGRGDKRTMELSWDEVERLLGSADIMAEPLSTDVDTAGLTSGTDEDTFRAKAIRGGTPLPAARPASPTDSEHEDERSEVPRLEDESSASDNYQPPVDHTSDLSMLEDDETRVESSPNISEVEEELLENFDQVARAEEERRLLDLLDNARTSSDHESKTKAETAEPESKHTASKPIHNSSDNWRDWTQYRAPWEELRTPVPPEHFLANTTDNEHAIPVTSTERQGSDTDFDTGRSSMGDRDRRRARTRSQADLPIRGARAYAAMQDRESVLNADAVSSDAEEEDPAVIPTETAEDVEMDDAMDLE